MLCSIDWVYRLSECKCNLKICALYFMWYKNTYMHTRWRDAREKRRVRVECVLVWEWMNCGGGGFIIRGMILATIVICALYVWEIFRSVDLIFSKFLTFSLSLSLALSVFWVTNFSHNHTDKLCITVFIAHKPIYHLIQVILFRFGWLLLVIDCYILYIYQFSAHRKWILIKTLI